MVGNIKYTKEIINSRLEYRGITVLDEYKGYQVNLNFKCNNGHTWLATPSNVLRKTGCPHCNGGVSFTDMEMQEIKSSLELRGITFDEYKNSITKVEFKCKEGHNWKTTLQSVTDGTGCPHCSARPPLTKEDMNKKLVGRDIKLVGEYKSCHTKTTFECEAGHVWEAMPDNIVRKEQGCPQCYLDFTKPAYVYVLDIIGPDDNFTGFGITNNKKDRISVHCAILAKSNKNIVRQKIFETTSRFIALDVENKLKTSLPIYNSEILGFKTEATKLDFETVINIIETQLLEKEYNV